ncbi:MAG: PLP-dependent transferase [Acidimicrobiales bacterium]
MKTLHIRVERQAANVLAVASHLSDHDLVTQVNYPGLTSHRSMR